MHTFNCVYYETFACNCSKNFEVWKQMKRHPKPRLSLTTVSSSLLTPQLQMLSSQGR